LQFKFLSQYFWKAIPRFLSRNASNVYENEEECTINDILSAIGKTISLYNFCNETLFETITSQKSRLSTISARLVLIRLSLRSNGSIFSTLNYIFMPFVLKLSLWPGNNIIHVPCHVRSLSQFCSTSSYLYNLYWFISVSYSINFLY